MHVRLDLCVSKNVTLALRSTVLWVLKGGSPNLNRVGGCSITVCRFGENAAIGSRTDANHVHKTRPLTLTYLPLLSWVGLVYLHGTRVLKCCLVIRMPSRLKKKAEQGSLSSTTRLLL